MEMVEQADAVPFISNTSHVFIKECTRTEDAITRGEMSAHQYFGDFAHYDSG